MLNRRRRIPIVLGAGELGQAFGIDDLEVRGREEAHDAVALQLGEMVDEQL